MCKYGEYYDYYKFDDNDDVTFDWNFSYIEDNNDDDFDYRYRSYNDYDDYNDDALMMIIFMV